MEGPTKEPTKRQTEKLPANLHRRPPGSPQGRKVAVGGFLDGLNLIEAQVNLPLNLYFIMKFPKGFVAPIWTCKLCPGLFGIPTATE